MDNNFDTFKREIDLIIRQNPLECELYSIIAFVLRSCDSSSGISIRDVTKLSRKSSVTNPKFRMYKNKDGNLAAADFLFMDTNYRYSYSEEKAEKNIFGVCEIKALNYGLDKSIKNRTKDLDKAINGDTQFEGELSTFKKLLYTNGIQWLYYEKEKYDKTKEHLWKIELGEYILHNEEVDTEPKNPNKSYSISDEDYVKWNGAEKWDNLLKNLNEMLKKMKSA